MKPSGIDGCVKLPFRIGTELTPSQLSSTFA